MLEQVGVFGAFGAADQIDSFGQLRLDMVAVEGRLGVEGCSSAPQENASDMSWQTSVICSPWRGREPQILHERAYGGSRPWPSIT